VCNPEEGLVEEPVEELDEEEENECVPYPSLFPVCSCVCGYDSPIAENTAELPSCEDNQYIKSSSSLILADGKEARCRLLNALDSNSSPNILSRI